MKLLQLILSTLSTALVALLAACSTVETVSSDLAEGEMTGTIAVAPVALAAAPDEGGAFPVYFVRELARRESGLRAVTLGGTLDADSSPAQLQAVGRAVGADWVLQPILLDENVGVRSTLAIDIDPDPWYYRRDRYLDPIYYGGLFGPFRDERYEAETRTTRSVALKLQLWRVEAGTVAWVGRGRATVSNRNEDLSFIAPPPAPEAPPAPHAAEALAVLAEDCAEELLEFAVD